MPTLYVENVPDDLYEALRARAGEHNKSISAEVLELLAENVATPSELARRRLFLKLTQKIRSRRSRSSGPFPATEEMLREDRGR
jgi:plasmid stability protein